MRISLLTKIMVPVFVVLVMLVLSIYLLVSFYTGNLAETLSNDRMLGAARTARVHLDSLEEQTQFVAYAISINPQFIELVHTRNREDMISYFEAHMDVFGATMFVITDQNGYVILRTHAPERYGDDGSFAPGIAAAMNGEITTVFTSITGLPIGMSSTAPVFDDEGNIIGTIVANYDFSSEELVDSFAEMFNAEVAFYVMDPDDGMRAVMTTIRTPYGRRIVGDEARADVTRSMLENKEELNLRVPLYGEEYHVFYFPLFGWANEVIGMFFIGFSNDLTNVALEQLQSVIIIIGVVCLMIAILLVLLILVRFLKPLEILTANVLRVSDTYTETVTVYGGDRNDEIGELSRSIQYMWNALRSMTKEVEISLEKAQAASKSKSRFLSNMSHEIRTPLNAITGMVTIGEASADIKRKDYALDKIKYASAHLLGVINNILDISKIEADKFELTPVSFHFERVIHGAVDFISFRTSEKNQTLIVNVSPAIPDYLTGDDQRLMQVITNLLSNAVKFTPEYGQITLNVFLLQEDDTACIIQIDVIDTGIGISEDQQSRIFLSFEQAENNTSRAYGGTGLGLAISRQIIKLMNGKLWVESVLGQGAKFSFTATLGRSDSQEDSEAASAAGINGVSFEGLRVLLAEDVEINSEIVISLLDGTGLEIDWAVNGAEAVELFRANPEKYDLIFMDVQMPEMDGFEATRQIRAIDSEAARNVPIVAMTANVFKEEVTQCLDSGMNDHIGKPIDYPVLIGKLRKYLTPQ